MYRWNLIGVFPGYNADTKLIVTDRLEVNVKSDV